MPRFCHEPGRLSFAAHLSANPFVDTMRAAKRAGRHHGENEGTKPNGMGAADECHP